MDIVVTLVVAIVIGAIAFAAGYFLQSRVFTAKKVEIETQRVAVDKKLAEADAQAKDVILKAKDQALVVRNEQEADNKRKRAELSREEDQMRQRREAMDRRLEQIESRNRKLENREKEADRAKARMDELENKKLLEIQRVAQMTPEEAKQLLLQAVEKETRQDAALLLARMLQPGEEPLQPLTGDGGGQSFRCDESRTAVARAEGCRLRPSGEIVGPDDEAGAHACGPIREGLLKRFLTACLQWSIPVASYDEGSVLVE
jgi:hypothetical protein